MLHREDILGGEDDASRRTHFARRYSVLNDSSTRALSHETNFYERRHYSRS